MSFFIEKLKEERNIFGDDIGYVELWNFSKANTNDESRIEAITTVASICYDNPNVIGKESLYNRLAAEAKGLPSSSFEFVPVLINVDDFDDIVIETSRLYEGDDRSFTLDVEKYGEWIIYDNFSYLLTNYRALYSDAERLKNIGSKDFTKLYNSEFECDIIKEYSTTFLYKMDLATSKQHNRHRVSLQELSRRYVSGKKNAFEFYDSVKLKSFISQHADDESDLHFDQEDINRILIERYNQLVSCHVKPQEARRVLPQSMYTTIWTTFLPFQLENYLELRDDSHAQKEIMWLAQAMKRLLLCD